MSRVLPLLAALGLAFALSSCDDEVCRQHRDCETPYLCVEGSCWLALCDPDDPICPDDTHCENGYCQDGAPDAGTSEDS